MVDSRKGALAVSARIISWFSRLDSDKLDQNFFEIYRGYIDLRSAESYQRTYQAFCDTIWFLSCHLDNAQQSLDPDLQFRIQLVISNKPCILQHSYGSLSLLV